MPFVFEYNSVSVTCSFQMTHTKEVTLRDTGVMHSGAWLTIDDSTSEMVFESVDAAHEENCIVKISSVITQPLRNYEAYFTFEVNLYLDPNPCLTDVITPGSALDMAYEVGVDG